MIFLIALNTLKWFLSISKQKLRQKNVKNTKNASMPHSKTSFFNRFCLFFSIFFTENGFESYIQVHKVLLDKKIQSKFFLVAGPSV